MKNLKLLTLGDGGVGKSCLLITYNTNAFPAEYVPTVFDNYSANITVDGNMYNIGFWDTAGQEDYDRLRPLSYPGTDIFLITFSVESQDSLENVKEKWLPEIRHFCPDTPCLLVACKTDLRSAEAERSRGRSGIITHDEGFNVAKSLGLQYVETSSLTHEGLEGCFHQAVRLAVAGQDARAEAKSLKNKLFGGKKKATELLVPPVMPPAGKAPWLEVETSTFAENWYKVLEDPRFHDVTFVVESRQLNAHKLILCSACTFFAKVLGVSVGTRTNQQRQMSAIDSFSEEDLNSGRVQGIASVLKETTHDNSNHLRTTIVLSDDIKAFTFLRILEFLYTGVPRLPEDTPESEIQELSRVAGFFKLSQLQTICSNIQNEEDFLNPSIGTFLNDETGAMLKALYFNQPDSADVIFNVQGSSVYGHRVVLSARSDVMAAMFSGNFSEGKEESIVKVNIPNTPVDTFLALLEYLYTDHAPIEEQDGLGILMVADEYCVPRLCNLCELYITKEVGRSCEKRIEKSDIDVIGLLNTAETFNAKQLSNWCLHFISTNFLAFENRQEFANLTKQHRQYVTEHRWPPLSYLNEVEEYEKKVANSGHGKQKCIVM